MVGLHGDKGNSTLDDTNYNTQKRILLNDYCVPGSVVNTLPCIKLHNLCNNLLIPMYA